MDNVDNTQMVGVQGDNIVIMLPKQKMTKHEALSLAAWLVTLSDDKGQFGEYLDTVQS